jgi:hypothetical protein
LQGKGTEIKVLFYLNNLLFMPDLAQIPSDTKQTLRERKKAVKGWVVKQICENTNAHATVQIARWWEMDQNGVASKHLDRYLAGVGGTQKVDFARVFREDTKVRNQIYSVVKEKIKSGVSSGEIQIISEHYGNRQWWLAIGSMNVNWEKAGASVVFTLHNEYQWHPERKSFIQCVHEAAESLKSIGAKNFWMDGKTTVLLTDM